MNHDTERRATLMNHDAERRATLMNHDAERRATLHSVYTSYRRRGLIESATCRFYPLPCPPVEKLSDIPAVSTRMPPRLGQDYSPGKGTGTPVPAAWAHLAQGIAR